MDLGEINNAGTGGGCGGGELLWRRVAAMTGVAFAGAVGVADAPLPNTVGALYSVGDGAASRDVLPHRDQFGFRLAAGFLSLRAIFRLREASEDVELEEDDEDEDEDEDEEREEDLLDELENEDDEEELDESRRFRLVAPPFRDFRLAFFSFFAFFLSFFNFLSLFIFFFSARPVVPG